MPELPEIMGFKKYIDSTSLQQKIQDVDVKNEKVLTDGSPAEFQEALNGKQFKSTSTHGKYLFLDLDSDQLLMMHFGMTGEPVYYQKAEQRPDYARVIINFSHDYHLAFNCMRMLGEMGLIKSKNEFIKEKELGPDVFAEDFDLKIFSELLQNKRGMIKSALMDQSLMAGIGNECSDEILFQSRIHPKTKVGDLDENQRRKIYDEMGKVLNKKTESNIKNEALPDSFILRHRSEGADCPICNEPIEKISVGGRNGYYCPQCQE